MLVASADALSAVTKVTVLASSTMSSVSGRPTFPTTQPKRRYMIRPRIVSTLGVKTPRKVPNFCTGSGPGPVASGRAAPSTLVSPAGGAVGDAIRGLSARLGARRRRQAPRADHSSGAGPEVERAHVLHLLSKRGRALQPITLLRRLI
jgi:hypothetical protein